MGCLQSFWVKGKKAKGLRQTYFFSFFLPTQSGFLVLHFAAKNRAGPEKYISNTTFLNLTKINGHDEFQVMQKTDIKDKESEISL